MDPLTGSLGLGIVISVRDMASKALDKIREKIKNLGDVSDEMVKKFDSGIKNIASGLAMMYGGIKSFSLLQSSFSASVDVATEFEYAMARVGAVTGATGEAFSSLQKQARDLGRDTQFTAMQAANSQEMLARAGLKTNEIIAAMPGLLNMAAAEGMELANAADIAASSLRGFGLEAGQMDRVADVLAKTSAISNTNISVLGESLKYVAPIARGLGISIEQTSAMIGAMANNGIKGSMSGTSLRAAFLRLSSEPKTTEKALAELGITSRDSNGNLKFLPELMGELSQRLQGFSEADRMKYLSGIFGTVAASGMLAIMNEAQSGNLQELEKLLYNCGGAAKAMADRMSDTAKGAVKRLESAAESLRIELGNMLLPVFTWIRNRLAEFYSWIVKIAQKYPTLTKIIVRGGVALLALASAAVTAGGALLAIDGVIKLWGILEKKILDVIKTIKSRIHDVIAVIRNFSWRIIGLIALAGALYIAWRKNLWGIRDMVEAVVQGFNMAVSASKDGIAKVDAELAARLKKSGIWEYAVIMGKVFWRIRQLWEGLCEGFMTGVNLIKSAFLKLSGTLGPVLEPFISGGQELLKMLGLLDPIAQSSSSKWKEWGKVIGELIPIVLTFYAALRTGIVIFNIISSISNAIHAVSGAISGLYALIMANPIAAAVAATAALIAYLYVYWDDFRTWFNGLWANLAKTVGAVLDYILSIFQVLIGAVTLDWGKCVDGLKNMFRSFGDFVKGVIDSIMGFLQPVFDGLRWIGEKLGIISASAPKTGANILKGEVPAMKPPQIPQNLDSADDQVRRFIVSPEIDLSRQIPVSDNMPAAEILARQSAGNAFAVNRLAQDSAEGKNIKLNNETKVDVKVTPSNTVLNIDGWRIGEAVTKWQVAQRVREGESEIG